MKHLILGATGATGRLLVGDLLARGHSVRALVRSAKRASELLGRNPNLELHEGSVADLEGTDFESLLQGCDGAASCLGHNLTLKGVLGPPYRLVRNAVRGVSHAADSLRPANPIRFVLMNTSGNVNRERGEKVGLGETIVLGLVRTFIPPHADNEQAARWLQEKVGKGNPNLEWVGVRPDTLIDAETVTDYDLHPSPIRSALFDAGETSRINVAHFMADLLEGGDLWNEWVGELPLIYNREASEKRA